MGAYIRPTAKDKLAEIRRQIRRTEKRLAGLENRESEYYRDLGAYFSALCEVEHVWMRVLEKSE